MGGAAVIPSLLPLFVVAAMRRAEERIHRQLADARALSAESAIELSISRSIDRNRLESLIRGGAVHVAANGRHFLDPDAWENHRLKRHRRALFAVSVLVALLGVGLTVAFLLQ